MTWLGLARIRIHALLCDCKFRADFETIEKAANDVSVCARVDWRTYFQTVDKIDAVPGIRPSAPLHFSLTNPFWLYQNDKNGSNMSVSFSKTLSIRMYVCLPHLSVSETLERTKHETP
jgi:hypothetical protein